MSTSFPQVEMTRVYGFSHYVFRVLYDVFFRGEIIGLDNIPKSGAFMIASNHASHLDPPIVGSLIPRQVSFFARKTLWTPGFGAWWLTAVDSIPVDRDGGSDVNAIKRVLGALKADKVVIMFPEGTRSPDGQLQSAKPGVGLFACRSGVPVIPARIFGSYEAFGRDGKLRIPTAVTVVYGRPIYPADYDDPKAGKDRYQLASERIMAQIAALQKPVETVI